MITEFIQVECNQYGRSQHFPVYKCLDDLIVPIFFLFVIGYFISKLLRSDDR